MSIHTSFIEKYNDAALTILCVQQTTSYHISGPWVQPLVQRWARHWYVLTFCQYKSPHTKKRALIFIVFFSLLSLLFQSPTLSPTLSPSLSPTLAPTLSTTLSPTLDPTLVSFKDFHFVAYMQQFSYSFTHYVCINTNDVTFWLSLFTAISQLSGTYTCTNVKPYAFANTFTINASTNGK